MVTVDERKGGRVSSLPFIYKAMTKYSFFPRVLATPLFLFCWILLALVITAGITAWLGQIPVYATGSGIILDNNVSASGGDGRAIALIFLPPSPALQLHAGMPIQVRTMGSDVNGIVDTVEPHFLSPSQVRQRYALSGASFWIITQPSLVVTARLDAGISRQLSPGSPVHAQLQVGSRRLISLFPGLNAT